MDILPVWNAYLPFTEKSHNGREPERQNWVKGVAVMLVLPSVLGECSREGVLLRVVLLQLEGLKCQVQLRQEVSLPKAGFAPAASVCARLLFGL